jgi:hypothetical protein
MSFRDALFTTRNLDCIVLRDSSSLALKGLFAALRVTMPLSFRGAPFATRNLMEKSHAA